MKQAVPFAAALICLGGPLPAASPVAEIICEPTPDLTEKLTRQYDVARTGRGMQGPDQLMELWTDAQGDWTLVVTYAGGTSCIVAMGDNWERFQAENPA